MPPETIACLQWCPTIHAQESLGCWHPEIQSEAEFYNWLILQTCICMCSKLARTTCNCNEKLTIRPPSTTIVPFLKLVQKGSLNNTLLNSFKNCWSQETTHDRSSISPTLSNIEALWKLKQTRNLAEDDFSGRLRVKLVAQEKHTDDATLYENSYITCKSAWLW